MTKDTDQKTGQSKICTKCGQDKPVTDYWNDKRAKDGKFHRCIECAKEDKRIRRGPPKEKNGWRKWAEEEILAAALKFKTKADFQRGSLTFYTAARRHPLGLEHFCSHMTPVNESWTFEKILERAKRYNSVREFRLGDYAAYNAGLRCGRKEKLYEHMTDVDIHTERYVYVIRSKDGQTAYVGLSQKPKKRYAEHKRSGRQVVKNLIATEHTFEIIAGPISERDAQQLEADTIFNMRAKGMNVLNSVAGGALGSLGCRKWTRELVAEEALKYSKIVDFENGSPGAYSAAHRRFGGIAQFCAHMKKLRYWDEYTIAEEAMKYKTRGEFWHAGGSAAQAAKRLGIVDKVCAHMPTDLRYATNTAGAST